MAVYAIGDLQGCFSALQRLLEKLKFDSAADCLWFVGDLVNRGSESLQALRFVKSLGSHARVVLGNHDLNLLAVAAGSRPIKPRDTLQDILQAPDRESLLQWLRHLPLLYHDAKLGFTMVHAGLPPQWDLPTAMRCAQEAQAVLQSERCDMFLQNMYGDQPDIWSEELQDMARYRFIVNCLTRIRYCDQEGHLSLQHKGTPGSQPKTYLPWFEIDDRKHRDLKIVFGHWSTLKRIPGNGLFPLDTACVWGGCLTALRLDHEAHPLFQVECDQAQKP